LCWCVRSNWFLKNNHNVHIRVLVYEKYSSYMFTCMSTLLCVRRIIHQQHHNIHTRLLVCSKTIIICIYTWQSCWLYTYMTRLMHWKQSYYVYISLHIHSCSCEIINTDVCVFVNVHRCCVWMWARIVVFQLVLLSMCVCARALLSCTRACVSVCIDLSFCPSICMVMCVLVFWCSCLCATDSMFSHTIH